MPRLVSIAAMKYPIFCNSLGTEEIVNESTLSVGQFMLLWKCMLTTAYIDFSVTRLLISSRKKNAYFVQ